MVCENKNNKCPHVSLPPYLVACRVQPDASVTDFGGLSGRRTERKRQPLRRSAFTSRYFHRGCWVSPDRQA